MSTHTLSLLAWICLGLGLIGQLAWATIDSRRPDMPRVAQDSMCAAVGTLILAPLIIWMALSGHSGFRDTATGLLFLLTAIVAQKMPWRGDTANHPVTTAWCVAMRRQHLRAKLCIAATAVLAVCASPEYAGLCGLGALAALKLPYLHAAVRGWATASGLQRLNTGLPFFLAFAVFFSGFEDGLIGPGNSFAFADMQLTITSRIPGDDPATLLLLQSYLGLSLLMLLLQVAADLALDFGKKDVDARLNARAMLFAVRSLLMIGLLVIYLLSNDMLSTFSAVFLWLYLAVIEACILLAPNPEPSLKAEPAPQAEAALTA